MKSELQTMAEHQKIDSDDLSIQDIFKDFYNVPDFQREYVWEDTNVERLLQDVLDEFYDEHDQVSPFGEYFIGSIVTYKDSNGVYHLIDGQQRMTTSFLVLCVIRDVIKGITGQSISWLDAMISFSKPDEFGNAIMMHRLILQYEDSQGVLEKIANNSDKISSIEPSTSSIEHILEAYQTISVFIQANFGNDIEKIKRFAALFTQRVKLIRIVTPNLSSALKLFETINDRGVGLTSMDLLKNLLFMRTSKDDYEKLKDLWKELIVEIDSCGEKPLRFLRYFILATYGLPQNKREFREDEIYQWFSKNEAVTKIDLDPIGFVSELIKNAKVYKYFSQGKTVTGNISPSLQNIASLSNRTRQHFILMLAAQHLPEDLFEKLASSIETLLFCFYISRESTKSFERSCGRWSMEVKAISSEIELTDFLERNISPEVALRVNAVDFALRELTSLRIQQYRLRYILAKLSQYVDEDAWDAKRPLYQVYYEGIQIEHILPQNPSGEMRASFDKPDEYDKYKTMLGNLVLLEKSINASVSNGSFELKKLGYASSKILLTSSLVEKPKVGVNTRINRATKTLKQFSTWDSESIRERQEMLVQLAHKVWNLP